MPFDDLVIGYTGEAMTLFAVCAGVTALVLAYLMTR